MNYARAGFENASARYSREIDNVPARSRKHIVHIFPPEVLSLTKNFEATVGAIDQIRMALNNPDALPYVHLERIKDLGGAAALVLTAEFDRWRRALGIPLKIRNHRRWDPTVRDWLVSMGFLDVLKVTNPWAPGTQNPAPDGVQYVKFVAGDFADGKSADLFRQKLEEATSTNLPIDETYEALTEAMTNSKHHAYPAEKMTEPHVPGGWWLCGTYYQRDRALSLRLFDQGVGIPATIEKTLREERKIRLSTLLELLDKSEDTHGNRIAVAVEAGKSATGQSNRGHGLVRNIRNLIEQSDGGFLRILSSKGEYIYEKDPNGGPDVIKAFDHSRPLRGTLIEWTVHLEEPNEDDDDIGSARLL